MSKVVVIGAGASGIIAALKASQNNDVILLDSNDKVGKKILLTGNGRCNYWNEAISIDKYNTDNLSALDDILSNKDKVLSYLKSLCIFPRVKNGYFYPYSNQASSIREIFQRTLDRSGVTFIPNFKVLSVDKIDDKFVIASENETIKADKVILATGSKACPKTGSDGSGYYIAEYFGHTINTVTPSLTKLITSDKCTKEWENVRSDVKLSLFVDNELEATEEGEIQLTKNGISGIVTFNISSKVSHALALGQKCVVEIDFLPTIKDFYDWFNDLNKAIPDKTVEEMFESLFNYKLMFTILNRAGIDRNARWSMMDTEDKLRLASTISSFKIKIIDTDGFDNAQVCTGGVSMDEINPETMESDKVSGLYLTGELLDVDGICGGYNLAFAFITGYLAGVNVK